MLDKLRESAFALGCEFAEAARQGHPAHGDDPERRFRYVALFQDCFFAVRVSIALELRIAREARLRGRSPSIVVAGHEASDSLDTEADERLDDVDPPDRADRADRYTERDRDTDRASFPVLLRALGDVAVGAASLPGPPPAELPTLRELLAQATAKGVGEAGAIRSPSGPARALDPPRSSAPDLRRRLATSSAAPLTLLPPPPQPSAASRLPLRPGTGPPRR